MVGLANISVSLDGGGSYAAAAAKGTLTSPGPSSEGESGPHGITTRNALVPAQLPFWYYNATLLSVQPVGGPVRGGTLATITGGGLIGELVPNPNPNSNPTP